MCKLYISKCRFESWHFHLKYDIEDQKKSGTRPVYLYCACLNLKVISIWYLNYVRWPVEHRRAILINGYKPNWIPSNVQKKIHALYSYNILSSKGFLCWIFALFAQRNMHFSIRKEIGEKGGMANYIAKGRISHWADREGEGRARWERGGRTNWKGEGRSHREGGGRTHQEEVGKPGCE